MPPVACLLAPPPEVLGPARVWAGRYIGNLTMTFSAGGDLTSLAGKPILLGGSGTSNYVPGESTLFDLATQLYQPVAALSTQVVGSTATVLNHDRNTRTTDTPMANLICVSHLHPGPLP